MKRQILWLVAAALMLPGAALAATSPSITSSHRSEAGNGFAGSSVYSNGVSGVSVVGAGVYGYGFAGYGGYFESRDGIALKGIQQGQTAAGDVWAGKVWRGPLTVDNRAAVMFVASAYDYESYQGDTPFCLLLHLADVPPGYSLAEPKGAFKFVSDTDPNRNGAFVEATSWDQTSGFQASIGSVGGRNFFFQQAPAAAEIRATQTAITVQANNGGAGQVVTFDRASAVFPTLTVTNLIYAGPTNGVPVDAVNPCGWIKFKMPDGTALFTRAYK